MKNVYFIRKDSHKYSMHRDNKTLYIFFSKIHNKHKEMNINEINVLSSLTFFKYFKITFLKTVEIFTFTFLLIDYKIILLNKKYLFDSGKKQKEIFERIYNIAVKEQGNRYRKEEHLEEL